MFSSSGSDSDSDGSETTEYRKGPSLHSDSSGDDDDDDTPGYPIDEDETKEVETHDDHDVVFPDFFPVANAYAPL